MFKEYFEINLFHIKEKSRKVHQNEGEETGPSKENYVA
jgi:hypothetical protein